MHSMHQNIQVMAVFQSRSALHSFWRKISPELLLCGHSSFLEKALQCSDHCINELVISVHFETYTHKSEPVLVQHKTSVPELESNNCVFFNWRLPSSNRYIHTTWSLLKSSYLWQRRGTSPPWEFSHWQLGQVYLPEKRASLKQIVHIFWFADPYLSVLPHWLKAASSNALP